VKRGFTLIEVILALALLALLLSLVQGVYTGATRSRNRARLETGEAHLSAVVLQRMASEISMAFFEKSRKNSADEYTTGFVVDADAGGNSSFSFTTRVPWIHGFSPGGDAEVGYLLEANEEGVLSLTRRESAALDGDLFDGGVPYVMLESVKRFEVLCYDGEEWVSTWDTAERTDPPYLPVAVSLEVAWGTTAETETEEGTERAYRTSTPVYGAAL
jgi:general secretion pathway protein J